MKLYFIEKESIFCTVHVNKTGTCKKRKEMCFLSFFFFAQFSQALSYSPDVKRYFPVEVSLRNQTLLSNIIAVVSFVEVLSYY